MNLTRQYLLFSLLVFFLIIALVYALSLTTYQGLIDESRMELESEAHRIENVLTSLLDETQTLMVYTGKRIAHEGVEDPQKIWKHMLAVLGRKDLYQKGTYWPDFFWLNDKNWQTINGIFGILAAPIDLSLRKYTHLVRQKPWVLFLDPPDFGRPSNRWIIPGGLGVEDSQGKFLGVIAVGFEISQLTQHINAMLANPAIEYAIFNNNLQPVIHSSPLIEFQSLLVSLQTGVDTYLKTKQQVNSDARTPLIEEYYLTPVPNYPLTIITYLKENSIYHRWLNIIIPHILEIAAIAAACFIILILFWRHIRERNHEFDKTQKKLKYAFELANASDFAKEDFLRSTSQHLIQPIEAIERKVAVLSKNLNNKIDTGLILERQIELLDEILKDAINFKNLTNNVLHISEIDLVSVVNDCVKIHSKQAYAKGITFDVTSDQPTAKLQADELKIKQVIVGLLAKAIKYKLPHEKIHVVISKKEVTETSYIQVVIKDIGLQLSNETLHRMDENFGAQEKTDYIDIEISAIKQLIYMHNGSCFVKNHSNQTSSITILLPVKHVVSSKRKIFLKIDNIEQFLL